MPRVFITEPTGPLGSALTRLYSEQGWDVIAADPAIPTDDEAFAAYVAALKPIDVLLICPRHVMHLDVMTATRDEVLTSLDLNVRRSFLYVRHIAARMRHDYQADLDAGREPTPRALLFIGSVHDEKPTASDFMFSASMGALQMFHEEAGLFYGTDGIHSVMIELGPMAGDEELFASAQTRIYHDPLIRIPRDRFLEVEELWPILDAAWRSPAINGAEIRADAGFTQTYNAIPRHRKEVK